MSVRAAWFAEKLDTPTVDADDPFSEVTVAENGNGAAPNGVAISANGNGNGHHPDAKVHPLPLDYWSAHNYTLQTPIDQLLARANELEGREENGRKAGITCELKGSLACSACPVCEIGQDTRKAALCRLGREQERIEALLVVKTKEEASVE